MKLWLFLGLEELELLSNVNITDDILYVGEKILKWNQFRLKTTSEAEEIVSSMLADLGIEGVQIEDKIPLTQQDKEQMFVDILPDIPEDDGVAYLTFYLDPDLDAGTVLAQVREEMEQMRAYVDVGDATIEESETEDVDWVNNWKQYFHQFYIDDILVIPSWEDVKAEDSDKLVIHIDPGTAFGTGMHETTQLCIRALRKYVKNGDLVLDVGCGSGILSIAALKLGAGSVVGTDVDGDCITSTHENMTVNHLAENSGEFYVGNLIDDKAFQEKIGTGYDLVVANILADIIIPMAPALYQCTKEQGVLITSGIIDFKENEVKEALEQAGFEILEVNHQGEWVNVTARKNQR